MMRGAGCAFVDNVPLGIDRVFPAPCGRLALFSKLEAVRHGNLVGQRVMSMASPLAVPRPAVLLDAATV